MKMNTQENGRIYADYAATCPVTDAVRRAMEPYLQTIYGNPSSIYKEGRETSRAIFAARRKCA